LIRQRPVEWRIDMKKMAGLALVLALSGCAVGPDYTAPSSVKPSAFLRGVNVTGEAPVATWWTGLGDAQLDALVAQGLAQAPQIAVAQARVMQARSGLANARAALLPSIGTTAAYLHADLPNTSISGLDNFYNLGFDAQWEVDLWGGKRRGVEQARAQADAVLAQKSDAEVALAAEIVRTYVGLRAREASLTLLTERCGIEVQQAALVEQRFSAGTQPRQSVEQARATVEKCRAELAAVKADAAGLRDALAVLTGQAPGALDGLATGAVPLPPRQVAVGDPARLIENRPDSRAAERA
jgi:NodT family efflux transporter outer membrane factor (OMF) lipoprotein